MSTHQSALCTLLSSSVLDHCDDVIIHFRRVKETSQRGVPSSPRQRERRHLEQEQELQSQDKREKEDDADEGASDDKSRADASGGSLIGVSHLSSRNNGGNSFRHNAS